MTDPKNHWEKQQEENDREPIMVDDLREYHDRLSAATWEEE